MARDTPDIYIIESVDLENEAEGEREGEALTEILKLSGKSPRYVYIRTKRELIPIESKETLKSIGEAQDIGQY